MPSRYFRQLQEISDTVIDAEWEGSLDEAMQLIQNEQTALTGKINMGKARQRYLEHLSKKEEDGDKDEDEEVCILCRCDFTRGYITQCAHVFCEVSYYATIGPSTKASMSLLGLFESLAWP
jgi:E3 ubiquitin-protein ligase SHPRH